MVVFFYLISFFLLQYIWLFLQGSFKFPWVTFQLLKCQRSYECRTLYDNKILQMEHSLLCFLLNLWLNINWMYLQKAAILFLLFRERSYINYNLVFRIVANGAFQGPLTMVCLRSLHWRKLSLSVWVIKN